jgi:hexosaminidase
MDIMIDLGSTEQLSNVQSTFMQIIGPGVYLPDFIDVSISTDGIKFEPAGKSLNDISPAVSSLLFKTFKIDLTGKEGRYIRFFAKHHDGYLFADEVVVE